MGIIEYEAENEAVKPVESFAEQLYTKQLSAITGISNTDWYKEIKRYWNEVLEWAEKELKTVKPEFLQIIQTKVLIAENFVNFLDNLEKAVRNEI